MNGQELYWSGDSVLHQLDPRLKVGALALVSLLLTLTRWPGLVLTSFALPGLVFISRVPLKSFRGMVFVLIWLGLFYSFATGWVWPENGYFWQGYWSKPGLQQAFVMLWRITLIFGLTRLFAAVTLPLEQGLGIVFFFTPLARLSQKGTEFALLIILTLRFIPLLLEEAALLWKARLIKGNWPSSRLHRSWEIMQLAVPLILLSLRRAEELGETMLARGYGSGSYRTIFFHERTGVDRWGGFVVGVWGMLLLIWH
ncbi:energy-coupling factor transporter transmembrane protein EcfT [Desulfosporosinus sp. PR]|uniref:energy-coupling factor transporter transmembrane component T family protein n=1 Tax=Candidatus Desulfosporosinus nitrosoreducens TaxID=3401928 RepID=UPI0027F862E3|nr:energy-coupling factor transporter transmembrane protein EcfT [Desulfosporosinus sp. PR]MDQ7094136.1 energy-coupling factor transporter transmembrane protein EcfT [Desulfosporosinus sp. PR]